MSGSAQLLAVDGLTKLYGGRTVVDRVNLQVAKGEIVGLFGRNGAGKSTTFRMLAGLVKPTAGKVFLRGADITALPLQRRVRRGIGYLPQERALLRRLNVKENLLAALETLDDPRAASAAELLADYGLADLADRKVSALSGGEEVRLELCRAMSLRPSLVMLDEPFGGVDPQGVERIETLILKIAGRGIGVLFADHNVAQSLRICDRAYIMSDGRILKDGTPPEILNPRP